MTASRLFRHWSTRILAPDKFIRRKYEHFMELLRIDALAQDVIADLDTHLYGHDPADMARIRSLTSQLVQAVRDMTLELSGMNPTLHDPLSKALERIRAEVATCLAEQDMDVSPPYILNLDEAADHPQRVGGKAFNLAVARRLGVPTPPGFVVTVQAFARYLRENKLEEEVERCFQDVSLANPDGIIQATAEMQELILAGTVPEDIAAQITTAAQDLSHGKFLAVRSSALAEDGRISFAGQYASELNVHPQDVLAAYKRALAGKYCPRAVAYRIRHGLSDVDTAMAVLVVPMIEAAAAGVVYTRDPSCAVRGESMAAYVVQGIGDQLVDGSATPGKYCLSREEPPRILSGSAFAGFSVLPDEAVVELGAWSLALERHFGEPQDVEWAFGPQGITILQTRRLLQDPEQEAFTAQEIAAAKVLLSGLDCAAPGAACGPVCHATLGTNFQDIPKGSVVVTSSMRPALSQFLDRIAAIVSESGSRASHLASVARERGIPVVVGRDGTSLLAGQIVTVDAAAGRIFSDCLPTIVERDLHAAEVRALLRAETEALVLRTVKLNLTDPQHPQFSPEGCQSLHDMVRFCHEQSVSEMFSLVGRGGRGLGKARRLTTDLPLVMYVLDLGGGLSTQSGDKGPVHAGHLTCRPLQPLWAGMTDERIAWDHSQLHVDWEEFDRVSGGIFRLDSKILASYALIASEYMHMNIRFGYHYSIVDSLCGDEPGTNYIKFCFKGGGAAMEQRGYRLVFIERVLSQSGFDTVIKGDKFDAAFSRRPAAETSRALHALGLILAATRLQDMKLHDRSQAEEEAQSFIDRFLLGRDR